MLTAFGSKCAYADQFVEKSECLPVTAVMEVTEKSLILLEGHRFLVTNLNLNAFQETDFYQNPRSGNS